MKRIGLGTVQWGMPYGIANKTGVATQEEVSAMLAQAREAGVQVLDTASAYGDAERVLGEHSAQANGFQIVTKTRQLSRTGMTPSESADAVEEAFKVSISRIGGAPVYGLLVHQTEDLLGPAGDALWARLQRLRSAGLAAKIGCSAYRPEQLSQLLDRYELELVQLPYNIYDQRFVTSGVATRLKTLGIEVHVRSVFLQGVLLMAPDRLPGRLASLYDHHAALYSKIAEFGLSPIQAAMCFCLASPAVDKVIVGCERVTQFLDILLAAQTTIPRNFLAAMAPFAIYEENLINPGRWV
jgi:aryl-alcohol dehydrogenase-like predicted oxidoreductase